MCGVCARMCGVCVHMHGVCVCACVGSMLGQRSSINYLGNKLTSTCSVEGSDVSVPLRECSSSSNCRKTLGLFFGFTSESSSVIYRKGGGTLTLSKV